jgi:hypothetical protein
VAFKAEELSTKIFPDSAHGLWAGCPQDTMTKGKPCQDNTKNPCPQNTHPDGGHPCPQDTMSPTTHPPRKAAAETLPLLRAQLRERLAREAAF